MPSKYVVRNLKEDSVYHIFNRGVEKRDIFLDDQDFRVFLFYLYIYITPVKQVLIKYPDFPLRLQGKNLSDEIKLLGYCLMPNHFHLLIEQKTKNGIPNFMKQAINGYTIYFNQKYKRVGSLMQGRYKAVSIDSDNLLIHVLRYIHLNPVSIGLTKELDQYKWSSYLDYLDKPNELVCSKKLLSSYFKGKQDFENFHKDQVNYAKELEKIKHLTIE